MPPLFSKPEEDGPGLLKRVGDNAAAVRYALFGYPGTGQVEQALNPDPQVTNRASMLPIGNYNDGSVGLTWPQSLIDAKEAFGRFHRGEAPQPQDAVLAGLAMTGGAFIPKPSNTVGMFGGRMARTADHAAPRKAHIGEAGIARPPSSAPPHVPEATPNLPMDTASRMQRAKELGFDTEGTVYHGSPRDFDEFRPGKGGHNTAQVWLTPQEAYAQTYAEKYRTGRPAKPYFMRPGRQKVVTKDDLPDLVGPDGLMRFHGDEFTRVLKDAADDGYDSVRFSQMSPDDNAPELSYPVDQIAVFDPKNIRSTNAAFDPAKSDSANILAANPKEAAPAGLLATSGFERNQPVTARVYRGAAREEEWPPGSGTKQGPFWASDNPEVANHYSGANYANDPGVKSPSITPADVTFQNPLVVDAMGRDWNMLPGYATTEHAAREAAKRGHDGLIVRNVADDGEIATTYAALQPGTVKSATTGETLFSNPKEAAPAGALAMDAASRMERAKAMGFDTDKTWYHGTPNQIEGDSLRPSSDGGVYISNHPNVANYHAMKDGGDGGSVMPMFVRGEPDITSVGQYVQARVQPDQLRSVNAAFDPAKSDSANILAANPKEAAPAGLLAASGLERMNAADNIPARPGIPDAPQSLPELEAYTRSKFQPGQSAADAAYQSDPQRYMAYANGLHDVLNPESNWITGNPTLHTGGAAAGLVPFGGPAPGLMQQPAQPDGPGLMAQQSPSDRLQGRGYLDKVPPSSVMQEALGQKQVDAYEAFMRQRIGALQAVGIPPQEARTLIESMPDVLSYRKRLSDEGMADPQLQDEIRKLLEDSR